MRLTAIVLGYVLLLGTDGLIAANEQDSRTTLFQNDQSYWKRLLQTGGDGSLPIPLPTPSPTAPTKPPPTDVPTAQPTEIPAVPPSSAPIVPPSDAPVVPPSDTPVVPPSDAPVVPPSDSPVVPPSDAPVAGCDINLDFTCALTDDPTSDCIVLNKVTKLQCSGCAPTALCFVYTGLPCPADDDRPSGIKACADTFGGPQAITDIVISNGDTVFVDKTVEVGGEICVTNGGAALPSELFVFISAPMGGNEPETNQLSTIDSTCQGEGLTLLESYGALNLTHYINCDGDNDCFVPVTFQVTVSSETPASQTITKLESTYNGEVTDLLDGADSSELRLEEGGAFVATKGYIAECCSGVDFQVSVDATAEGDDGSICPQGGGLNIEKPLGTPPPATAPTPPTKAPTTSTPEPTDAQSDVPFAIPSDVPTPLPETPPPTPEPTPLQPVGTPDDSCFAQVDVTCVPPVDPASPDGARFEDCDSINIAPAECTEFVNLLTFRFNGGDCLDSNNIQDPRIYSCEDFFDGPPAADDIGAESYMVIADIKGQGITYFDGIIKVGDVFNITNILPNTVIVANVNVTIYAGEPAPENLRETIIIHTSCSQVTFLKDRYGVLELIGFQNPSQGYQACIVPVSFDFAIQNTAEGFNAVVESLVSVTNFDPPNNLLNFTDEVVGFVLNPGDELPISSDSINIDLSIRKRYTVFTTVQGVSPEGFSCRGSEFSNFTAGVADTRPTPSPASGTP
ncbi:hypothetical protein MHU86_5910 [Fragilaria crotonensis]|nr:hypothetical protein MHU86_5910 [Fragilaria crotonensis]